MIRADLHNHTIASHGEADVPEMYAAAAARGLGWYGLSEHSPLPPGYSCPLYHGDLNATFPAYAAKVLALKTAAARGKGPQVLLGMELDWIPSDMVWMRGMLARYPFDHVIGGLHFVDHLAVGAPRNWTEEVGEEERFARYTAYYREMARMASSGLVNIVAHPDFIKVRSFESFHVWLKRKDSLATIRQSLAAMRAHGVAMEVSSAGLRKDFREPYPGPAIMELAAALDLAISFGSDAHNTADTGSDFTELAAYARAFGYRESIIFEGRKARALAF